MQYEARSPQQVEAARKVLEAEAEAQQEKQRQQELLEGWKAFVAEVT